MGMLPLVSDYTDKLTHATEEITKTGRRGFLKTTIGGALGVLISGPVGMQGCASRWARHRRPEKTKYDTITHEMLDIELEHVQSAEAYRFLDSMIDVANNILSTKKLSEINDKESIVFVLETVGKLLDVYGFEYQKNALLSVALQTKKIDCDGYSFIYLAIGEALGLPIKMVRAPAHTFIRWHLSDSEYVNWETTVKSEKDDDYYIQKHKIDRAAKGISSMRSMDVVEDRDQILANAFVNCGVEWLKKMKFDKSIARFDEAIRRDPYYEAPYYNTGLVHYHMDDMPQAILWCEKAVSLNPNHMKSHAVLGTAYLEIKDRRKARMHFRRVQELDPEYYRSKIHDMRLSEGLENVIDPTPVAQNHPSESGDSKI